MDNNAQNLYEKGLDYRYGRNGVAQNDFSAYKLFLEASNSGHSGAMNELGLLFENRVIAAIPPKTNLQEAYCWFLRGANSEAYSNPNEVLSRYNLARLIASNPKVNGNPRGDMELALKVIKTVCNILTENDTLFVQSNFILGCILLQHYRDYSGAYKAFILAAVSGQRTNNNISAAWYNLGYISESKKCPDSDLNDLNHAVGFYSSAASLGDVEAMDSLARIYTNAGNYLEAMKWAQMAVDNGYVPAQKRLRGIKFLYYNS